MRSQAQTVHLSLIAKIALWVMAIFLIAYWSHHVSGVVNTPSSSAPERAF